TTGTTGEYPAARTASGSQPITGCPARTESPRATCTVKPSPCCFTVSMPKCTSTARPSSPATTNACGCRVATVPSIGDNASARPPSGCTAIPGPTIACANTASGTSVIDTVVPATGLCTIMLTAGPGCL